MRITELTRRSIIDFLLLRDRHFTGALDLIPFLKRIWDLSSMPSGDPRHEDAEGDIWRHAVINPDWDDHFLLYERLNLLNVDDSEFLKLLEECVHPLVVRDPVERNQLVEDLNEFLLGDDYELREAGAISRRALYKAIDCLRDASEEFEIVLSFAGENRAYVRDVAKFLKSNGVKQFYDGYEEVSLWGKDLVEHFDRVFRISGRYCVMFISEPYARKVWTVHERQSALARALKEKREYILPARFDDTELPGLRPTVAYVDLRLKTPEELGRMILEKLGRVLEKQTHGG